ncbi:MAG: hypothetical protein D6723_08085 [Acidobacteria bacterium]|nr:MAG: hypothetical protein D6723_08085 [Acidobacteriota bacterium]
MFMLIHPGTIHDEAHPHRIDGVVRQVRDGSASSGDVGRGSRYLCRTERHGLLDGGNAHR